MTAIAAEQVRHPGVGRGASGSSLPAVRPPHTCWRTMPILGQQNSWPAQPLVLFVKLRLRPPRLHVPSTPPRYCIASSSSTSSSLATSRRGPPQPSCHVAPHAHHAAPEKPHRPGGVGSRGASGSSAPHAVRVLDTALVHPYSSGDGPALPQDTSLPLTFFDVLWLPKPPVQCLLFYRLAPDDDADAVLANLRAALSHSLRAFFPLAGRLRLTPGTANRYELHYRPGDAVAFTVAEYDVDFDSLAADEPKEVAAIAPLAPPLPDGGAVLAVQATLVRGGLALGVTMHHAACDGSAVTHFLHTWAAAGNAGSQRPPAPPVINRTLISDPRGLYDVLCPAVVALDDKKTPNDLLFATFTLSRDHLQRVKDVVVAASAAPPRCTSLVAALGLVWSCYQRANPRGGDGSSSDRTCLSFPVDYRSRLRPPLSDKYFGNCVGSAIATSSKRELAEAAGSAVLLAACRAIATGIEDALSGVATETMGERNARLTDLAATTAVLKGSWSPRFRVYELDMGFGRPAKVDIVSVARTGAVAVAQSRAGDGGIEVGLTLPPDGMDAFRKCFADAVAGLDLEVKL